MKNKVALLFAIIIMTTAFGQEDNLPQKIGDNFSLEGALALNRNLFPEIYNHLLMNINYSRCKAHIETAEVNSENTPQHGYNNIERTIDA